MLTNEQLIQIRRDLHQIPELALEEKQTQKYLLQVIHQFRQDYLEIKTVPELPTAILVRVKGSNPTKTIGYRADIDGLPVTEKTGLPFSSKHDGQMHACGHDIHMTVALGFNQQKKAKMGANLLTSKGSSLVSGVLMNFLHFTLPLTCLLEQLAAAMALYLPEQQKLTSIYTGKMGMQLILSGQMTWLWLRQL